MIIRGFYLGFRLFLLVDVDAPCRQKKLGHVFLYAELVITYVFIIIIVLRYYQYILFRKLGTYP